MKHDTEIGPLNAETGQRPSDSAENGRSGDAVSGSDRSSDSIEVELKLAGPPNRLSKAFRACTGTTPKPKTVVSTYYDTSDQRLWHRGYTLRLRPSGNAFELTLKQRAAGAIDRGEWTSLIDEPIADLGRLPPDAPRAALGLVLPEELTACYVSDIARAKQIVEIDGARVEVALDRGTIRSGDETCPVSELEFELKSGSVGALLTLADRVLDRTPLTVGTLTKSDRGSMLADGTPPAWLKAAKPLLQPRDTLDQAMAKIVSASTTQTLGNLAAAADGRDPEGVHQLRVSLRRLRSAISLFRPQLAETADALDAMAKAALKRLGVARDLDVFLDETIAPVLTDDPDNAALQRLAGNAERQRKAAYDDVRALVADGDFSRFLIALLRASVDGGLIARNGDGRLRPLAAALLAKRRRKVLKAGRQFAALTTDQRHEVRIALKKLRYACDFFQTLFPGKLTQRYLKSMADLQDDLGRLNDASVAETVVDRLSEGDGEAALGGAIVKGWYRHRLITAEPHMLKAWQAFAASTPFWRP